MPAKHVTHWIGGKPWTGTARAPGRHLRPRDRAGQRRRRLRDAGRRRRRGGRRQGGRASPGAASRSPSAPRSCSPSASWSRATPTELAALITSEHGKVASDAAGEVARGLEVVEFACGIPHLLKGGFSRERVHRRGLVLASGSRSASSPASRRSTSPPWCRCGCSRVAIACGNTFVLKPSEKDPSASILLAELWAEAGLPDGVFNVVHGDKVAVDALLDPPGRRRGLLRRLHPDRPLRLRDGHQRGQAGAGARRRQEPHGGAARRRPGPGRRRGRLGRLRQRGGALHGDLRARRGRPGRRRAGRQDQGAGRQADRRPRQRRALGDGPARHRAAPGQGRLLPRHRRRAGRHAGDRRPRRTRSPAARRRAERRRLLARPVAARPRDAGQRLLPRRDLRPGAVGGPRRSRTTTRSTWSTTARTATAWRSSPTTAAPPGGSSPRPRSAWSASTCRSRCRWPTTPSAAGRRRCSATRTCTAPRACTSTPAARSSPRAGSTRRHGGVNLGLPGQLLGLLRPAGAGPSGARG